MMAQNETRAIMFLESADRDRTQLRLAEYASYDGANETRTITFLESASYGDANETRAIISRGIRGSR